MANLKFEAALSRLEETVSRLEKGDLSLEESLKVFEDGVRLSKNLTKILNEAEKKVELLIQDKDGTKQTRPLDVTTILASKTVLPESLPHLTSPYKGEESPNNVPVLLYYRSSF